jgi:alpha-N-arabinofuranosidase
VFDLYAPHKGNDAVRTTVDAPVRELADGEELPLLGASASVGDEGTYVTVTNLDCRASRVVAVDLEGASPDPAGVDASVLFAGQEPDLVVDADNADEFAAEALDVDVSPGGTLTVELAPSTVAAVAVE